MIKNIEKYGFKHCIDNSNIHQSVIYKWYACKDQILLKPKGSKKFGSGRRPLLEPAVENSYPIDYKYGINKMHG